LRAEFADVIAVHGAEVGVSKHDDKTEYRACGIVTAAGAFVQVGGVLHRLPATAQPVAQWVAQVEVNLCPECGEPVCECIPPEAMAALLARIDADPHGVNELTSIDIPF
jgi:hypothetical protein